MKIEIVVDAKTAIGSVAYLYTDRDPIRFVRLTEPEGGQLELQFYTASGLESVQRLIDALTHVRDGMVADRATERRGNGVEAVSFPAPKAEAVPA